MTDKKLKVGNTAYTELSIQIGVLEAKVDKILQLLLEQQKPYIVNNDFVSVGEGFDIEKLKHAFGVPDNETFDECYK